MAYRYYHFALHYQLYALCLYSEYKTVELKIFNLVFEFLRLTVDLNYNDRLSMLLCKLTRNVVNTQTLKHFMLIFIRYLNDNHQLVPL